MTDITELAQRMKAAAMRAKAATEDYVAHRMSITVYLEECKEFNDLSDGPDNILALVEALEKAQQERDEFRKRLKLERSILEDADKRIAELEEAEQKLCAANVTLDARAELAERQLAEMESRTVTIEPFRSFVTDADLAALHRFAECCDDPESGGHDLEKEQVRRLEAIGALQRSGRISYITDFGDVLISITNGIKWEAE
ncbi:MULTISPECIES: hypothetical protein [Klebsiella]|uniref:hypothetical protein n=1 Tax=Klebsiella TaxID=570 RepID=UPI001CCCBDB5|nr:MULTISPECIES: hypothetical protein [Klebsiella]MBZ6647030.1 hypothetical protein [Klebsiella michiganensis]MBZ7675069.1 hypothetical protein [Klebsiella grimontii]